jgi:hypothetical protein
MRWLLAPITLSLCVSCSSDPEPAPEPPKQLFSDSFDDPAPLPRGWTSGRGSVSLIDVPDAPSPPRAFDAQSVLPRTEALLHRDLVIEPGAVKLTCRFMVKLTRYGGNTPLTVARIDVANGAVLFDLKPDEWQAYTKIGSQQYADGNKAAVIDHYVAVVIAIGNDGAIVASLNGDQVVRHADVKASPIDVTRSSLEIGLLQPPGDADTEALFDDVSCTSSKSGS